MNLYTVFGLVDNEAEPPALIVAAVVEGGIDAVDATSGDTYLQRYAQSFEAETPWGAELAAIENVAG